MRMATNKINVLVAPAHLVLSDVCGSESTWALNIMKYIVRNYREIFLAQFTASSNFRNGFLD